MSLLPREGLAGEDSPHIESDDDSSSSTPSSTNNEHPALATLNEVYNMTEQLQRQDDERHRIEEQQRQTQKEEMRLRREELEVRVTSALQRLRSTHEPTDDWEETGAGTTTLKVEQPNSFEDDKVLRINRKYAVLPRKTRLWHFLYNNLRFLFVSLSYAPGIDPKEVHADHEYYQRAEYN
ncbi:hypothetical protein LSM04_000500 [Trypanosoma melophagium]|uniref:uncharacterized protein n=1 Tax=Trypanosoma melophagium TaxID=715481 RepID=UPI00351A78AF|nr:hypothetical protein LSM04_000500 [Trypanosoma melophagium]